MITTTKASKPQPSLLNLPAEIRNLIYHYVADDKQFAKQLNALDEPPLAATCRQIQSEFLPIYLANSRYHYRLHKFVPFPPTLGGLTTSLAPSTRQWLAAAGPSASHIMVLDVFSSSASHWGFMVWQIDVSGSEPRVRVDFDRVASALCSKELQPTAKDVALGLQDMLAEMRLSSVSGRIGLREVDAIRAVLSKVPWMACVPAEL